MNAQDATTTAGAHTTAAGAMFDTFGSAQYPVPETHYRFHQSA